MSVYAYTVTGLAERRTPNEQVRDYEESGVIEAEHAGEAIDILNSREIEWGILDEDEEIVITLKAVQVVA